MATWRKLITECMSAHGESWDDVEASTLSEEDLDVEFNDGHFGDGGEPFTVWTKKRVYFPACFDGSEWCDSVSRHPDGKATDHVGG